MKFLGSLLVISLTLVGCVTDSKSSKQKEYHMDQVWYPGSVEDAFKKAKTEKKLVFLYWGAVWCPPCNELKDQVFSKPAFADKMQPFVPVYLDGDTDRAQKWADKLNAYGYPTVLVLDGNYDEKLRLSGAVNIDEFSEAMAYVSSSNQSLSGLMAKAQQGDMSMVEWKALAYLSWGQLPDSYDDAKIWRLQKKLLDQVPSSLPTVRAILTAEFIGKSIALKDQKDLDMAAVRKNSESLLSAIFASRETIMFTRQYVNFEVDSFLEFFFPKRTGAYQKWRGRWIEAATDIENNEDLSVDTRLWAVNVPLALFNLEKATKDQAIPSNLKNKIISAVKTADDRATTNYERHSVISGAAYLLRQVQAYTEAEALLLKEVKTTDTPWYYQSSLSNLFNAQGKTKEALYWSGEARKSAKGRATKLQWITNDLLLHAKQSDKESKAQLIRLVREFYSLALELKDGFSGRNQFRARRVAKSLKPFLKEPPFRQELEAYQKQCMAGQGDSNCKDHFAGLL